MSIARLIFVWVALEALLALTFGASFLPLGPAMPFVSYGIATAKMALVVWFFMEMRSADGLNRIAFGVAFLFLSFLFILSSADVIARGWLGG